MRPKLKTKHAPSARFARWAHLALPPRLALLRKAYAHAPLLSGFPTGNTVQP